MAIAATGNVGSKLHTDPEIEAIRAVEAQKSADLIGTELIMLGCKYAEAFRVMQTWPNHKAYRLLPLCSSLLLKWKPTHRRCG